MSSSLEPRRALHELLGTRWALTILEALVSRPVRFAALARAVPGVSHRMLAKTARDLVAHGLVTRHAGDRTVTYSLTVTGLTVLCWSSTELAVHPQSEPKAVAS